MEDESMKLEQHALSLLSGAIEKADSALGRQGLEHIKRRLDELHGRASILESALRAVIRFGHPLARCECRGCVATRALVDAPGPTSSKLTGE